VELINILGIALLALLVRKLIWCLWCYYRGRKTPEPIPFLPRRSGTLFSDHVRQAREEPDQSEEEER
jgi:hypothetical protein